LISAENPHRFLIVRTDRLGDVILSLPVANALKQSFPDAFCGILVRDYTEELVNGHPDIDLVLIDDQRKKHRGLTGLLKLAREIRARRFQVAILLHPTLRLALLCFLCNIPKRIGTGYRMYSILFNKKIYQHRKNSKRHECDLNLDFAKSLGAEISKVKFNMAISNSALEKVNGIIHASGIAPGSPFIVIHPGSGGSALDWPPAKFRELARRITMESKWPVLITGTSLEKPLVEKVADQNPQIIRLDGKLSIQELAALLEKAALLIANSTGPLHLAVAVGTQVIGLYCPVGPCRPERWGPYQRTDSVIMPPVESCAACKPGQCRHYNCMDLITVEQVYVQIKKKLMGEDHAL
jgi:lipopolysaccharide heptosyltransferase II